MSKSQQQQPLAAENKARIVNHLSRVEKGRHIAATCRIYKVQGVEIYWVESETTRNKFYRISPNKCECQDFVKRLEKSKEQDISTIEVEPCKHMYAINFYFEAKRQESKEEIELEFVP